MTTEPVCFEVHVPGDLSVARGLARAGYVVVTNDPLGYHRSSYDLPQGGRLLSLGAHRGMLHEIVEQLRGVTTAPTATAPPATGPWPGSARAGWS